MATNPIDIKPSQRPDDAENAPKDATSTTTSATSRPQPASAGGPTGLPFTPRRLTTGLHVQVPARMQPMSFLDPALGYSVAKRPGLDFSRSCTSLHHSTLADSSDSSPKTPSGFPTPRKALESPIAMHHSSFDMDSGSESDISDDEDLEDLEIDSLLARQNSVTDAQGSVSLLKLRHAARLQGRLRSRQSSSSGSGSSTSVASLSPTTSSVPFDKTNNGFFGKPLDEIMNKRRDSLSAAMNEVVFKANQDEEVERTEKALGTQLDAIRRPVTRRGNMLPKPKHFQRVKAALLEESAPADSEVQREAIVTRQMREDDEEDMPVTPMTPLPAAQIEIADSTGRPINRRQNLSFRSHARNNEGFWDAIESSSPPSWMRMNSDGDIVMASEAVNSPSTAFYSPEVRRLKRSRGDEDARFEQPEIFKRRAVSPGVSQSPIGSSSPISVTSNAKPTGTAAKRLSFIQDTNDGLLKMSIGSSFG